MIEITITDLIGLMILSFSIGSGATVLGYMVYSEAERRAVRKLKQSEEWRKRE